MTRTHSDRHWFRDLARAVSWHRRKLAVAAAVAAVITGISAARPPDPPTLDVVRTTREIPAGATVSASDVRVDRIPQATVPQAAMTDLDAVVGKAVSGPVAGGQVVTGLDLGAPRASRPGMVVAPLRLTEADIAGLLRVGDRVDVIAADGSGAQARVVATDVMIVGLPRPADDGGLAGGGTQGGTLVLVEVDLKTATALSQTAAAGRLGVVLR